MCQTLETLECEAKDKLVIEYLELCREFMAWDTTREQKAKTRIRLNEIRLALGMELI